MTEKPDELQAGSACLPRPCSVSEPDGILRFYREPHGLVLRVPRWDEFGCRLDSDYSLSDETGKRLLAELMEALKQNDKLTRPHE